MEITGKIIAVLPLKSGVSARTGKQWTSQEYVLETSEQYPKKCCFSVFGEEKIKNFNIQQGSHYTVSFDIDAREYQGRWYNSLNAWRVSSANQEPASPAPAPAPASTPSPANNSDDDVPF